MGGVLLGGAVTLGVTLSLWRGRGPMLSCRLGEWSAISPRAPHGGPAKIVSHAFEAPLRQTRAHTEQPPCMAMSGRACMHGEGPLGAPCRAERSLGKRLPT